MSHTKKYYLKNKQCRTLICKKKKTRTKKKVSKQLKNKSYKKIKGGDNQKLRLRWHNVVMARNNNKLNTQKDIWLDNLSKIMIEDKYNVLIQNEAADLHYEISITPTYANYGTAYAELKDKYNALMKKIEEAATYYVLNDGHSKYKNNNFSNRNTQPFYEIPVNNNRYDSPGYENPSYKLSPIYAVPNEPQNLATELANRISMLSKNNNKNTYSHLIGKTSQKKKQNIPNTYDVAKKNMEMP